MDVESARSATGGPRVPAPLQEQQPAATTSDAAQSAGRPANSQHALGSARALASAESAAEPVDSAAREEALVARAGEAGS